MRTLDISKVNKERHKWQRIDTPRQLGEGAGGLRKAT